MKRLLLLSLVGFVLLTGCGNKTKNNDGKDNNGEEETPIANTNEGIIQDKNVDGLEFTNASLVRENGLSVLKVLVTNNTGSDYAVKNFQIVAKDKDGNVMHEVPIVGSIGDNGIANGESKTITGVIDVDLTNATSLEYTPVK